MKMVIERVYPPIPTRDNDWCAYMDGFEEDRHYGWGRTKEAAIQDLIDQYGDAWCHECYEQIFCEDGPLCCPNCKGVKVTLLEDL